MPGTWRTATTADQWEKRWGAVEEYLERAIVSVPPRYLREGTVQAGISRFAAPDLVVVDREAVVGFSSRSEKARLGVTLLTPLMKAVEDGQPAWWKPKTPGDECDAVAITRAGEVLAIEVKPASVDIAWAAVEHLHEINRARALFATHYHELTELSGRLGRVKNFNVAVREWNDQIIFLRKIVPGGTDKSYGIQVARLAGLPASIISRAKEILSNLEQHELNAEGKPTLAEPPPPQKFGKPRNKKKAAEAMETMKPQMTLF